MLKVKNTKMLKVMLKCEKSKILKC
jgi:hypothetical protein